mgnify:CR=1 FL=1
MKDIIKQHIVTAVAVIQRDDGRILLLKRSAHEKVYPNVFTFPGGKVENNDTISETLVKEVQEECGLELNPGFILIKEKSIGRPDGKTSKSLSFLCTVKNHDDIVLEEASFSEYRWVNRQELQDLEHVGIDAEFAKVEEVKGSGVAREPFYVDTDKVDFRL